MNIRITDNKTIFSIQQEFNATFPFLKIEFFKHKHGNHQLNPKKDMLSPALTLKQISKKHISGTIEIKENMRVADLESAFWDLFNLSAQVFRKSAGTWIETSVTDDWTLKQQNEEGKDLSNLFKADNVE